MNGKVFLYISLLAFLPMVGMNETKQQPMAIVTVKGQTEYFYAHNMFFNISDDESNGEWRLRKQHFPEQNFQLKNFKLAVNQDNFEIHGKVELNGQNLPVELSVSKEDVNENVNLKAKEHTLGFGATKLFYKSRKQNPCVLPIISVHLNEDDMSFIADALDSHRPFSITHLFGDSHKYEDPDRWKEGGARGDATLCIFPIGEDKDGKPTYSESELAKDTDATISKDSDVINEVLIMDVVMTEKGATQAKSHKFYTVSIDSKEWLARKELYNIENVSVLNMISVFSGQHNDIIVVGDINETAVTLNFSKDNFLFIEQKGSDLVGCYVESADEKHQLTPGNSFFLISKSKLTSMLQMSDLEKSLFGKDSAKKTSFFSEHINKIIGIIGASGLVALIYYFNVDVLNYLKNVCNFSMVSKK